MALTPNSAAQTQGPAGLPRLKLPGGRVIEEPHPEWTQQAIRWRWLMDSWEGGEQYRNAVYGLDSAQMPVRNLVRHKREYPSGLESQQYSPQAGRPVGTDQAAQATDDDYELRRARTPVPSMLRDAIECHVSKVYNREIARPERENPGPLVEWWRDVDGCGLSIDQWMADVAAPILLTLGQLDLLFDRPERPPGVAIRSQADQQAAGLNRCIVSVILPENLVWWRADRFGRFQECLVRETTDRGAVRWRYWSPLGWCLYGSDGRPLDPGAREDGPDDGRDREPALVPHGFGRVPIVRLFDRRRPRSRMVGLPRYEVIAEIQRELYNRDSELILSDTTQAHPLLQGPEDYVQPDGTVPIGPNWLLPKKKNQAGSYEGFDVVVFPKDGAESIRANKQDLIDQSDRAAGLTKPAGAQGTTGQTVAQSGVSKRLDQDRGNELLGKIARVLERAEQSIGEMVLAVLGKPAGPESIRVRYPTEFALMSADEFSAACIQFQAILSGSGSAPVAEGQLLKKLIRLILPGMDEDQYLELDREIDAKLGEAARLRKQQQEAGVSPDGQPLFGPPIQAPGDGPAGNEPDSDEG